MIKYVQYLSITWIITSYLKSCYRHNYFPEMIKLSEQHGNWRLTVVQSECKTKLILILISHVAECIFE